MNKVRLYPQLELLNTWAIDRTRFSPDATNPPLCLRCGRPLNPVLAYNALSRHIDVHICDTCGTDEALSDETWALKPLCSFDQIYLNTSEDLLGHKSPRTELAYSRSDYDGHKWWTNWFTAREELKTPERIEEIDQFMESLFALPEMSSLEAMRQMCRIYAEPTSERTEFNLYCDTNRFHVWLRLVTRQRDYNLYVHFYVADEK